MGDLVIATTPKAPTARGEDKKTNLGKNRAMFQRAGLVWCAIGIGM